MKYLPPQDMLPYLTETITILRSLREHSNSAEIALIRCMPLLEMQRPLPKQSRISLLKLSIPAGYYDDPRDKRRTLQNIEDACRAYLQHHNFAAWTPYVDKETGFIGIEVPIDLLIECDLGRFRFVGKVDAIIDNVTMDKSKSTRTRPAVVLMMPGQCPSTCLTKLRATSLQAGLSFHQKERRDINSGVRAWIANPTSS